MIKVIKHPLPFFDERPSSIVVDTLVIHAMCNPESDNCFDPHECFSLFEKYGVSSHFTIERKGAIWECVSPELRAWHAGESFFPPDGRKKVNDFSIGIELIGKVEEGFTKEQYDSLIVLIRELLKQFPLKYIVAHSTIAPGRKVDPGPLFKWEELHLFLQEVGIKKV